MTDKTNLPYPATLDQFLSPRPLSELEHDPGQLQEFADAAQWLVAKIADCEQRLHNIRRRERQLALRSELKELEQVVVSSAVVQRELDALQAIHSEVHRLYLIRLAASTKTDPNDLLHRRKVLIAGRGYSTR